MRTSTVLSAAAVCLAQAVSADFMIWFVDEQAMDCTGGPTCKPIQSGSTVAPGPLSDIPHDCGESINHPAYAPDGDYATNAKDGDGIYWSDGICGMSSKYTCYRDGDDLNCSADEGDQWDANCKKKDGDSASCEYSVSITNYLSSLWECTSDFECE